MFGISKQNFFYISWLSISLLFVFLAIYFDGTGGNGDSLYHFLYSKYSWQDKSLFFNHWAKPLFTIVSSPFAQFGFTGIKLFNVLASSLTVLVVYKIAVHFQLKYSHLIFIPLFAAPLFFEVTFTGLTEPFSALILSLFILIWLKNKKVSALILISFIPFIRSEGLIILGVIITYLIYTKNWRYIPYLVFGHLVFTLLGFVYYKDILWVFTKNPYAKLSSVYGIGNWSHFIHQLYFCLGPITYLFLIIGLIKLMKDLFLDKAKHLLFNEKLFFIYGIFLAFFVAHASFWALGIFNSMGLNRVFVTVFPLVALICIEGFGWFAASLPNKLENSIVLILSAFTIVFTCLHNPASIDFKSDLNLTAEQQLVKNEIVPYLKSKFPNKSYMTGDVSIPYFANRNTFDPKQSLLLYDTKPQLYADTNFVFIWDPWFAKVEGALDLGELKQSPKLIQDKSLSTIGEKGDTLTFIVFRRVRL